MPRETFEPGDDLSLEGFVERAAVRSYKEREEGVECRRVMTYAYRVQGAGLGMMQLIHHFKSVQMPSRRYRHPSRAEVQDGAVMCGLQHILDHRLLEPYAACGRRVMQDGSAVFCPVRWDPAEWGHSPSRDLRLRLRTADKEKIHDLAEECWIAPSTLVTVCLLDGLAQSERWLVPDAWFLGEVVGSFFSLLTAEQQRLDHLLKVRQGDVNSTKTEARP